MWNRVCSPEQGLQTFPFSLRAESGRDAARRQQTTGRHGCPQPATVSSTASEGKDTLMDRSGVPTGDAEGLLLLERQKPYLPQILQSTGCQAVRSGSPDRAPADPAEAFPHRRQMPDEPGATAGKAGGTVPGAGIEKKRNCPGRFHSCGVFCSAGQK